MASTVPFASIPVISVSRRVYQWLEGSIDGASVFAVFDRVCNIAVTPDESGQREIIALVTPQVGDGPLNIVLDDGFDMAAVFPKTPVTCEAGQLTVGEWRFAVAVAPQWQPRPQWRRLSVAPQRINSLLKLAGQRARAGTLLELVVESGGGKSSGANGTDMLHGAIKEAMASMEAGWRCADARWLNGVSRLVGLGPGLTPAGDDFVAGVMLATWLLHDTPGLLCRQWLSVVEGRTTLLSQGLLRRAADGECTAAWHRLLATLSAGSCDEGDTIALLDALLSLGHTSGGDALAGFFWMCRLLLGCSPVVAAQAS